VAPDDAELQRIAVHIRSGFVPARHALADDIESAVLCALFANRSQDRGILFTAGKRAAVDEIRRQTRGTAPRTLRRRQREYDEAEAAIRGRWRMEPSRDAVLRRLREKHGWSDTIVRNFLAGPFIVGSKDATNALGQTLEEARCAADPAPNAAENLLRREDLASVRAKIGRLPPAERETIEMRYLRGWNLKKTARARGVSSQRVWQIEQSALAKLRRLLVAESKIL
jgi:RNA polymerase sigma factor (sigma-70 family)